MVDLGGRESVFFQQREERGEQQIERTEITAIGLRRIEPAGVVREQHAFEVAAFLHLRAELQVASDRRGIQPIEREPRAAICSGEDVVIARAVGVNPDEGAWGDSMIAQHVEFGEAGSAAGVDRDRQPGGGMRQRSRGNERAMNRGEGGIDVYAALDEARANAGSVDPIAEFADPAVNFWPTSIAMSSISPVP